MNTVKMVLVLAVSALTLGGSYAQSSEKAEKREARQEKRMQKMIKKLDLTEGEKEAFLPIFEQYIREKKTLRDQHRPKKERGGKKLEELSDSEVRSILEKSFDHRRAELDLQERYYEKFQRVLPIRKVAKIFHMERKMRAKHLKGKRKKHRKMNKNADQ